ncbi:MAG: hypothetical protein ABJP45_15815 [Cyclobacteriaceae bacterium]
MRQNKFNDAAWDSELATYKQLIQFQNGKSIDGYSKKIDCTEMNDKISLLTNWIIRMYKKGYLDPNNPARDPISFIEYKHNRTGELILRLYYNYCEWGESILEKRNIGKLITFINRFYELISAGHSSAEIVSKLYDSKAKKSVKLYDLDAKRFSNEQELVRYCHVLIHEKGADIGRVKTFFHAYKTKFNISNSNSSNPISENLIKLFTNWKE